MKQSFIITAILCLALGESFSVISKKEKAQEKAASYYCQKACGPQAGKEPAAKVDPEPYIPMVNILGYN